MEEMFVQLLEEAKKDKAKLVTLKNLAVNCNCFALAAEIMDIEKELFPDLPKWESNFA